MGKSGEFEDFLAVQMRSVGGCSWRFSKLWISRGFGTVTVLVGEVWRIVEKNLVGEEEMCDAVKF